MTQLRRSQRGAAVVDFVLILMLLVPLVLGLLQLSLVLFVRNTLASAAAEGARVGAAADRPIGASVARTRAEMRGVIGGKYAEDIEARTIVLHGVRTVEVTVKATVPALGLGGPGIELTVKGHAVEEQR